MGSKQLGGCDGQDGRDSSTQPRIACASVALAALRGQPFGIGFSLGILVIGQGAQQTCGGQPGDVGNGVGDHGPQVDPVIKAGGEVEQVPSRTPIERCEQFHPGTDPQVAQAQTVDEVITEPVTVSDDAEGNAEPVPVDGARLRDRHGQVRASGEPIAQFTGVLGSGKEPIDIP